MSESEMRSAFASQTTTRDGKPWGLSWALDASDYWPLAHVVWTLSPEGTR